MKKILIFIITLLFAIPGIAKTASNFSTSGDAPAGHFQTVWTGNGYYQMNINMLEAKLSGVNLEAGDEIAAYDGSLCVGVVRITGAYTTLSMVASKDDGTLAPSKNGYTEGDAILLKYWDASRSKEVIATINDNGRNLYSPTYLAGGSVFVRLSGKTDLTITIGATDKPYDGTLQATVPSLSVVATGVVTGQNVNVAVSNARFDTKNVGTSNVTADVTLSGTDAGNYTVSPTVTTTANITAKVITITPGTGQTKVYGQADPALSYTFSPALIGSDAITGSLGRDGDNSSGSKAFTLGSLTAGTNYDLQIVGSPATFAIAKAELTVTADAKSKVYGAAEPTLTYTASGTLYYGDAYSSVITGVTMSTTTLAAASTGTHPITISGGTSANYNITHVAGTLTVAKAELTVTADDQSKVYGATDPTLTFTASGNRFYGDAYTVITGVTMATSTGSAATAGTHDITISGGTAVNYNVTHVKGTLTVNQASLTVTADNKSKVYGAADPALTFTPSGVLYYGDAYALITGVSLSTPTDGAATAGVHDITISGGTADNYIVTHVKGALTVAKAELTVTADSKSKVYGASEPTLSYTASGTLLYTDTYSVITGVTMGTLTAANATAGTHPITITGATAANYNITTVGGVLTVEKAVLTAKADNQTKVYKTVNPTLTFQYSDWVYGAEIIDTPPTIGTTVTTDSDAGSYPGFITLSGGLDNNYTFSFGAGNFLVSKVPLTITADNKSKCYDGSIYNGGYTATYSGFVGGEDEKELDTQVSYTGTAIAATGVGAAYSIVPGGAYSENYSFTYNNGSLAIYALPLPTITGTTSVCAGTTGVTYTTEAGQSGYNWIVSDGGTITSATNTNSITVSWTTPGAKTVSVNYINTQGCSAATATVKNITVNPLPTAVLTNETVTNWCATSATNLIVTLTGTAPWSIVYIIDGVDQTAITGINASPYSISVTPSANATTGYTLGSVSDANDCSNTGTGSVSYTVLPILVAPTASGAKTICPASDAGSITATAATGGKTPYSSYQWKKSINGGSSWTDCITGGYNTLTLLAGSLTTTTQYKLFVTDACNSVKESNTVIVTVRDAFTAPVIGNSPVVCYNTRPDVALSASAALGGSNSFTYQWQKKTTGNWSDITNAKALTYMPDPITEATSFRIVGFDASCGACYSNVVTITINPSVGTPTAITVAGGTEPTCQIVGSATTTYSSTVTNGTLAYTVTPEGAGSIETTSGIMSWANGFSGAATITATATGCNGPKSVTREVNITPTVGATTFSAGATTVCQDAANETYTALATNGVIAYSVSPSGAGTIDAGTGSMNWDAAFSGEAIIIATATGCNGSTVAQRIVTVTPSVGTQTAISVSGGTEPSCQIVGSATTTTYLSLADNGTIAYTVSPVGAGTIGALTGVMSWADGYHGTATITATASGCNAPAALTREVIVAPSVSTPVFTLGATTVCQDAASGTYTATASNGTVTYSVSPVEAGTIGETTGVMDWGANFVGTATITAIATGCNGPKTAIRVVTVKATLTNPVIGSAQFLCNGEAPNALTITTPATGGNGTIVYQWQSSADGSTNWVNVSEPTTGSLYSDIYYKVVATPNGTPSCGSTESAVVKITVYNPLDKSVISGPPTVCSNDKPTLTATAATGGNGDFKYEWLQKPTANGSWTIVGDNSTSYTPAAGLTEATSFRLIAYNQGTLNCGAITSLDFAVTVNPRPVDPIVSGPAVVLNASTGNVYTVQSGMSNYSWTVSSGGAITAGATSNAITVTWNNAKDQTVTVNYTNTNGCSAVNPAVYAVTVATLSVNLKVFLEGPYNGGAMNTNLASRIPLSQQPYNVAPWNYSGTESVASLPAGIVDWVLVELRQADAPANASSGTVMAKRAAFLKSDGTIVDLDGSSPLVFSNVVLATGKNLYPVIRHRNHLAIMAASGVTQTAGVYTYDFSSSLNQAYGAGSGYKAVGSKFAMVAGDVDKDGSIYVSDYSLWATNYSRVNGYYDFDIDMDGACYVSDYSKWAVNYGKEINGGALLKSVKLNADSDKSEVTKPQFSSSVPK